MFQFNNTFLRYCLVRKAVIWYFLSRKDNQLTMAHTSEAPQGTLEDANAMFADLLLKEDISSLAEAEGINTREGVNDLLLTEDDLTPNPESGTYVSYGEIGAREAWESTPKAPEVKEAS